MLKILTSKGSELLALGLYVHFEGQLYHLTMVDYLGLTTQEVIQIRHWASEHFNLPIDVTLCRLEDIRIKQLLLANCYHLDTLATDTDPMVRTRASWMLQVLAMGNAAA